MVKLSKSSKLFAMSALSAMTLFGCSGEEQSTETSAQGLSNDTAFAFVERSVSVEAQANIDLYTESLQSKTRAPLDASSPYEFRPGAKLVVKSSLDINAVAQEVLTGYFGSENFDVKDLNTSADGSRLVFAAHGPENHATDYTWNIYEYDFASKSLRRVISSDAVANAGQDTNPTYTHDGKIVFSSDRAAGNPDSPVDNRVDDEDPQYCTKIPTQEKPSLLHSMTLQGEDILQLTYGDNHDVEPTTMDDGRVVFVRWSRSYELATQCGSNFQKTFSGTEDYKDVFVATKTDGLSKPEGWDRDAMCQFAIETPVGAAIAKNHYTVLRITSDGSTLDQLYETVTVGGSDEAFLAINGLRQGENGKLVAILQHQYNQFLGGNPVELQSPQEATAERVFGSIAPRSVIDGEVDLYPNQVSIKGWYSALDTYRDGTERKLLSWSKCTTLDDRNISAFCRVDSNVEDVDNQYGLWVLEGREMLPITRAKRDMLYSDIAIAQPHANAAYPYAAYKTDIQDNLDSSRVVCNFPPTPLPSPTYTPIWTPVPTPSPSVTPTVLPTPTVMPTIPPSPVVVPTMVPSPSVMPTVLPSPTVMPTVLPSPTVLPTALPSPTVMPTVVPSPTVMPTVVPSPTVLPTVVPSPTVLPTALPSPTVMPTVLPSPSVMPTVLPSPTVMPTVEPTPTTVPSPTIVPSPIVVPTPSAEPSPTVVPEPSPIITPPVDPCAHVPATPAVPADPNGPGEPADPATPAIPADPCTPPEPANTRPVARANDRSTQVGALLVLDGSGSSDADGDALTFAWRVIEASAENGLTLTMADTATPVASARVRGRYTVELVVHDGKVASEPALAAITVMNTQPVANAGADMSTFVGERLTLDGSASGDADGDALSYRWRLLSDEGLTLSAGDSAKPEVGVLAQGRYTVELVVNDGELDSAPDTVSILVGNRLPIANAGADRAANVTEEITLDGSASRDPEGAELSFSWFVAEESVAGGISLSHASSAAPTVVASEQGEYVIGLRVNDGQDDSAVDFVSITVGNVAPVANAGADQRVHIGSSMRLDGSASTDADGDRLTYLWTVVEAENPAALTISANNVARPVISVTELGFYRLQLVVNDGFVDSAPDFVVLDVGNIRPVANAGADQSGLPGDVVSLDGSASSDADGDMLSYQWSVLVAPEGSSAAVVNDQAAVATFSPDVLGQYTLQLVVNDGYADSEADTMTIDSTNMAPVANAGVDRSGYLNLAITLDGGASSDPEGDALSYSWSVISQPEGAAAELVDADSVNPSITLNAFGDYVLQLIVNDGYQDSVPDVMVISTENLAPSAEAGADQNASVDDMVSLDGSASRDPEGMALSYRWSFTKVPTGADVALDSSSVMMPNFIADKAGTYILQLIVNDGVNDSAADTVTVEVKDAPFHCDYSNESRRTFPAIIRDFKQSHPDFEYRIGFEEGIVAQDLGADGLPVYANQGGRTYTTNGAESFNQWFRDVENVNTRIPMEFQMERVYDDNEYVWEYRNFDFFPIDNMGWGNQGHQHNYHFTLESHMNFFYRGGERFMFAGDDDLWIYINGKLAIDIGGVHNIVVREIIIDELADYLGIEKGQTYSFDLFFAERHTVKSVFKFQTTLDLKCAQ